MPLHLLSHIKITKYFSYEPWFNGIFSRDNLLEYENVINTGDKQSKETNCVSLFIYRNTGMYFDLFGIGYICQ